MTTKLPVLVNPSEAYNEEVIKCIKDTLKQKSGELICKYEPSKAFIRDQESYITDIDDTNKAWKEKYNRRKKNLAKGFFADRSKAYQSVGKVYLESGDLIYSALTHDLRNNLIRSPKKFVTKWHKTGKINKKMVPPTKKPNQLENNDSHEPAHLDAGYAVLKQRLQEVKKMRKGVYATQSLYTYLSHKDLDDKIEKKEEYGMIAPQKNQWKIVRAVGKIMGGLARPKEGPPSITATVLKSAFRKKVNSKKIIENDMEEMEDKEEALMRWRHERKQMYLIQKLQAINMVLCALFNMKHRSVKQHVPLSYKAVRDLFRQNIAMDQYNNPISTKIPLTHGTDDQVNNSESTTPDQDAGAKVVQTSARKRVSSVAISNYGRKPRLSQHAGRVMRGGDPHTQKVETWEDLLNAGDKNKKLKSAGFGRLSIKHGHKIRHIFTLLIRKLTERFRRRRDTHTPSQTDNSVPWHTIAHQEKTISGKKKAALIGSVSRRTAEDVLRDIHLDFIKLQKQLAKESNQEMTKLKNDEFKLIHNKFKAICLGPIPNLALDKMRNESRIMCQDRNDETTKPMKWFVDLREEINVETSLKNETINSILKLVARFQYENVDTMPLAKEKLCLLILSMPLHMLMTNATMHAISFVLTKILGCPIELLEIWLTCRKISKTSA